MIPTNLAMTRQHHLVWLVFNHATVHGNVMICKAINYKCPSRKESRLIEQNIETIWTNTIKYSQWRAEILPTYRSTSPTNWPHWVSIENEMLNKFSGPEYTSSVLFLDWLRWNCLVVCFFCCCSYVNFPTLGSIRVFVFFVIVIFFWERLSYHLWEDPSLMFEHSIFLAEPLHNEAPFSRHIVNSYISIILFRNRKQGQQGNKVYETRKQHSAFMNGVWLKPVMYCSAGSVR